MRYHSHFGATLGVALSKVVAPDWVRAALLYMVLVVGIYAPVAFAGRSLQAPLYYPPGPGEDRVYQSGERSPANTFNIDLGTPAFYEWPLNRLVGQLYQRGELPLWNPYQGAGTPLAAQYSTRAFFPYQVLEDMLPPWTWDYFLLGRLWIAGVFTFLFLRLLGASRPSAFLGGVFYMLSGTLVWFINLEQMSNVAMVTPLLLWTVEGIWRWRPGLGTAGTAMSVALVLLGGQPEVAVYVLLLGAAYYAFRLAGTASAARLRIIGAGVLAGLLGLALAAPQILLFLELTQYGHTIHPPGGTMGIQGPARLFDAPALFIPTFFDNPTWYRFFPENGRWDYLGGYTGVLPIYLILVGIISLVMQPRSPWKKPLLFFAGFGFFVLLKNFGFPLVSWAGLLPLLDQAWSPRWAGPAWTFSLAVAGALGLETLQRRLGSGAASRESENRGMKRSRSWWRSPANAGWLLAAFLYLAAVLVTLLMASMAGLAQQVGLSQGKVGEFIGSPYFVFSAGVGSLVALTLLITAGCLSHRPLHTGLRARAFIALGLLELWFAIPMGYDADALRWKLLPLGVGLLIVAALACRKHKWVLIAVPAFVISTLILDYTAQFGLPSRHDPSTAPPYVGYLKSTQGFYRLVGGDGVLLPNFASAAGLFDVRYINSVAVSSYQNFRAHKLHSYPLWSEASTALWFTGNPQLDANIDGKGVRIHRALWQDLEANLPYYSLLGVKHILAPSPSGGPAENLLSQGQVQNWPRDATFPPKGNAHLTASGPAGPVTMSGEAVHGDTNAAGQDSYFTSIISANGPIYFWQALTDPYRILGKTLSFSLEAKTQTDETLRIGISRTGVGTAWSGYHVGDGAWQTLEVTQAAAPSVAEQVFAVIEISAPATIYLQDPMLWAGTGRTGPVLSSSYPLVYDNEIRIYENPSVLPRVFVANEVQYADSYQAAQEAISQQGFDLAQRVVLEEPLSPEYAPTSRGVASAEITGYHPNQVTVKAALDGTGVLVLTDLFYPGWEAYVDRIPAKIYRADGLVRGVILQPGEHEVVFKYNPESLKLGLLAAGTAILVSFCVLISALLITPRKHSKD